MERLLQNNLKHVSIPKESNNNFDTSSPGPTRATIAINKPQLNPVHFVDTYDHINNMYNTNNDTHLVNEYEEQII